MQLRFFIAILSLLSSIVTAAPVPVDTKVLTERLENIRSFQASFIQQVVDKQGAMVQETSGRLVAKRPDLFYWHTDAPLEQVIVSNGENVWVYDPDLEQVTAQKLDDRISNTPALLLSGKVDALNDAYEVRLLNAVEGAELFRLVPKGEDSLFEHLTLRFVNGVLVEMSLQDSLGQKSNISFLEVQVNQPVPASQFEPNFPEGVDYISEIGHESP